MLNLSRISCSKNQYLNNIYIFYILIDFLLVKIESDAKGYTLAMSHTPSACIYISTERKYVRSQGRESQNHGKFRMGPVANLRDQGT